MKNTFSFLFTFLITCHLVTGQIQSGPMVGYSTMREVAIWVQLEENGNVQVKYWPKGDKENTFYSKMMPSHTDKANTLTIPITGLEPGTIYNYTVLVNKEEIKLSYPTTFQTQALWAYRQDPPDFSFLAGSCFYVNEEKYEKKGKPNGAHYEILENMARTDAEFMVWLGDNFYLREMDYDSRSGIFHRHTHTRSLSQLQPLLAAKHHYAIWDDHDYGPNDSDYTYYGKEWTREAFESFWANPVVGVGNSQGITGFFYWADCDFFLMDNRWYRSPKSVDGQILGSTQIEWLLDALSESKASVHFICVGGQVLSPIESFENHANYYSERDYLLDQLDRRDIKNVVFLTGDRHHSEVSKYTTEDGQIFYEITASPLTSTPHPHENEGNIYRIDGSHYGKRNFAKIHVTGGYKARKVSMSFHDVNGKEVYRYDLKF